MFLNFTLMGTVCMSFLQPAILKIKYIFKIGSYIVHSSKPVVLNRRQFCLPKGHLAISGDIFGCHNVK